MGKYNYEVEILQFLIRVQEIARKKKTPEVYIFATIDDEGELWLRCSESPKMREYPEILIANRSHSAINDIEISEILTCLSELAHSAFVKLEKEFFLDMK